MEKGYISPTMDEIEVHPVRDTGRKEKIKEGSAQRDNR